MGMVIERGLHGWVGWPPIELENCSWNYGFYGIGGLDQLSFKSMLSGIYAVSEAMSSRASSTMKYPFPNSLDPCVENLLLLYRVRIS
jgi:hypothetical protein